MVGNPKDRKIEIIRERKIVYIENDKQRTLKNINSQIIRGKSSITKEKYWQIILYLRFTRFMHVATYGNGKERIMKKTDYVNNSSKDQTLQKKK